MKYFSYLILFLMICGSLYTQPTSQIENAEELPQFLGNYYKSITYGGEDSSWNVMNVRSRVYNQAGRITDFIQKKYENGGYVNESKLIIIYTNDSVQKEVHNFIWNGDAWFENSRSELIYDVNFRILENINYIFLDEEWLISQRIINSYDTIGRISEQVTQRLFGNNIDTVKAIYNYDDNGNLTQILSLSFDNNQWVNVQNVDYFYQDGNYSGEELKFWTANQTWMNYTKDSIVLDDLNRISENIRLKWNDTSYQNNYKYLYFYNNNNSMRLYKYMDWVGTRWDSTSQLAYTYNSFGKIMQKQKDRYRNNAWSFEQKSNLLYNENNELTEFKKSIWVGNKWYNNIKINYDYTPTGINSQSFDKLNIYSFNYPNPFSDETSIKFSLKKPGFLSLNIYDLQGHLVLSRNEYFNSGNEQTIQINSEHLVSGTYYYILQSEEIINSNILNVIK